MSRTTELAGGTAVPADAGERSGAPGRAGRGQAQGRRRPVLRCCFLLALCLPLLGAAYQTPAFAAPMQLMGAGSTFDQPFFNQAFADYAAHNPVSVAYQSVGSGAGILQFINNHVDFGATDVPMNQIELTLAASTGSPVIEIPIVLGGVVIAYNEPNIPGTNPLQLDGPTLAAIFLGRITTWNDPAIAALNPGLSLPHDQILAVHRSDSSGTTFIFTNYLSSVSQAWAAGIGKGKSVAWIGGFRGKGSPGVAAWVRQHQGSIGYVEQTYALGMDLRYARIRNQSGIFVAPTPASVAAAAAQYPNISADHFSIVNAPGQQSYPIAGYSWVILRSHPLDRARGQALVKLLRWLVTAGQADAALLRYAPLPAVAQARALAGLSTGD